MLKKALLALYIGNILIILWFWWQGSGTLLTASTSGTLIALARLSGLLGMYSILVQYTLMSRNPVILRNLGLESFKLHRYNGIAALSLVTAHVILVTSGYALASGKSWLAQDLVFIQSFEYVLLAMVAYAVMLVTVGASLEIVRRHLRPKVWLTIHVCNHAVVWLAVLHQFENGGDLLANDLFRLYWLLLITFTLMHLFYFRFVYKYLRPS